MSENKQSMQWNNFKDHPPYIGQWIAAYREPWPSYYWMGQFVDIRLLDEEEMFDYWIEIPAMKKIEND